MLKYFKFVQVDCVNCKFDPEFRMFSKTRASSKKQSKTPAQATVNEENIQNLFNGFTGRYFRYFTFELLVIK